MNNREILVIGLGNPILGDDGVGWHVANKVQDTLRQAPDLINKVEVDCLAVGGLTLMERLVGYKHVVLIDALVTTSHPPGSIICKDLFDLQEKSVGHLSSAHDISLKHALELGRLNGAQIPETISIVGVAAKLVYDFSEQLSPAVAQAIPEATNLTISLIHQLI